MALTPEQKQEVSYNCGILLNFLKDRGWSTGMTMGVLRVTLASLEQIISEMTEEGPDNAGDVN